MVKNLIDFYSKTLFNDIITILFNFTKRQRRPSKSSSQDVIKTLLMGLEPVVNVTEKNGSSEKFHE